MQRRIFGVIVAVSATVLVLSACAGSPDASKGTPSASQPSEKSAPVSPPPKIASAGEINYCTDPSLGPPASYVEDGKYLGSDIEIGRTAAALMGVSAVFQTISFNTLIPSINSGLCDAYIGGLNNTPERAKQVAFVDYATVGTQFLVPKGNPEKLVSEESLSGHTAAVVLGTTQQADLEAVNVKLTAAGKTPINIKVFQQGTLAVQAVATGQADTSVQSFPALLALIDKQPGKFEFGLPELVHALPFSIASAKDDVALNTAFSQAIDLMYEDGSIVTILKKAGLEGTLLEK